MDIQTGSAKILMLRIILIGSVAVIFLTELSQETIWEETAGAIAVALIVIWLLLWFDLVRAGRPHKQAKQTESGQKGKQRRYR
jgi:uncharacterized membrane protein